MTKILVLSGGTSDERAVSLRSGASVAKALMVSGYEVLIADPADSKVELENIVKEIDVVFPVLHGIGGEDGSIQLWLEEHGILYVGTDSDSSAKCFDKWLYKQRLQAAGILTPRGELVTAMSIGKSELIHAPFVLKPYNGGSSIDTFVVRNPGSHVNSLYDSALLRHGRMLIEELIEGTEITIGVLHNEALPVIEILPPADEEFDYENKYNGKTREICPPENVSSKAQKSSQDIALQINKLLNIRDLSRTDIIISQNGLPYVLETNTIPGMTNASLFPLAASVAGYSMPQLVSKLVDSALDRFTR